MARHPFTRSAAGDPWRVAWLGALVLILATSWRGNAWLDGVRQLLDGTSLALVLAGGIAAMIAWPGIRLLRTGSPGTRRSLLAAVLACAVVLLVIPPGPRWMHPALFVPFGFLSLRAFDARTGVALIAFVAAGDEAFQHLLAERTGSALDVGANALSGLAGAALAAAGSRTRWTPAQKD